MAAKLQLSTTSAVSDATLGDVVSTTKAVGDARRAAILRAMAGDSFGVLELCEVFELAQPAMSHHLKVLRLAGLVSQRREGNSVFYQRIPEFEQPSLVAAIFAAIDRTPISPSLDQRIKALHQQRAAASLSFFEQNADALKSQHALICDVDTYAPKLAEDWRRNVGCFNRAIEIGPGNGRVLRALAADFANVIGIDQAKAMLDAARPAVAGLANVTLKQKDFLNFSRERFDFILAAMVLHHAPEPAKIFRRAATLLNSGGVLGVVELCPHQHAWVREACGDLWLGLAPLALNEWATQAQLTPLSSQTMSQKNGFQIQILYFSKE